MEGHHYPRTAPTKSHDLEKKPEKHSTEKGDKITKTKKTKGTSRMHSFDREFKDGKYYKNPDVSRKTPSYMRQTCASLTKVKTMRNNGTSPGPERKDKSSLNPLAEDDEDDTQFQTGSDEDFSGEDQFSEGSYDFNEANEDDEAERSIEEEVDTEVKEKVSNFEEANSSSSAQPAVHEDSHTGEDSKLSEEVQDVEMECLVTVDPNQHKIQKDSSTDDASKTTQETTQITDSQDAKVLNTIANAEENEAKIETQKDASLSSVQKASSTKEDVEEYVESQIDLSRASKPREISAEDMQSAFQSTQGQSQGTQSTSEALDDNPVQTVDPIQSISTGIASGDHSGLHQRPGKSKPEGQDRDEGSSSGVGADQSKIVVENKECRFYFSNKTLRTIGAGAVAGFFGAAVLLFGIGLTSKGYN